jgi:hypothetical protein
MLVKFPHSNIVLNVPGNFALWLVVGI